jgi:hypothetical protein
MLPNCGLAEENVSDKPLCTAMADRFGIWSGTLQALHEVIMYVGLKAQQLSQTTSVETYSK